MIYFIENRRAKAIKIGFAARDPHRRLRAFQTGSPDKLRMIGVVDGSLTDEGRVKVRFATTCILGEWFRDTEELRRYIGAALAAGYAIHGDAAGGQIADQVAAILGPGKRFPLPIDDQWPRYALLVAGLQESITEYVGFPVEISYLTEPWWSGAKGRALSYQVEPSSGAGYGDHDSARFWDWFAGDDPPCFASVVQAADAFVDAWDYWNRSVKLRRVTG